VHRNRTLVLKGSAATPTTDENTKPDAIETTNSIGWVCKNDRHRQLINPAIYDKQSQQRVKAMEETRKLKLRQRDEKERAKLRQHLQVGVSRDQLLTEAYLFSYNVKLTLQAASRRLLH